MIQDTLSPAELFTHDDPIIAKKVQYYAEWLADDAVRNRVANSAQIIDEYEHIAALPTFVDGQEIVTFAPFEPKRSALQTTTSKQSLILWAIFALYILSLTFYSVSGLIAIIAATTAFYVIDLLIYFLVSVRVFNQPSEQNIEDEVIHALAQVEWPTYTILCPLYREARIVPQFVKAMKALDYPQERLQVLFLTEEDDGATRQAIQALHLPPNFEIVTVPDGQPRTKPRACNYGLLRTRGSYVVIFDAEDVPDPLQLKKAVLAFANSDPDTVCVQAKLNFYNSKKNMLTRWFTAEYSSWFDMTLPGLQMLNIPLPLGGTSNHFRTDALRKLGAWDAFNVTEDCELGLRLASHGMKTVVLDSTTLEEANANFNSWLRQRSRWIKGYMQTYLVYMRNPLEYFRKGQIREFLSLQFIIGGKTAILLINPLMWMLVLVYIFCHSFVSGAYHILYPMPVLYMASLCLIFGNVLYVYTHLIGCMKRQHYPLVKSTIFIPIYWAMASVAAYIALYQLIIKPHYWEKTLHGVHLLTQTTANRLQAITLQVVAVSTTYQLEAMAEPVISAENTSSSLAANAVPIKPELAQPAEAASALPAKSNSTIVWQLMRFAIVGVGNTLIDLLMLNCLILIFPTQNPGLLVVYNSVSYLLGAINSFVLNKYWTFHRTQRTTKGELLRFTIVNVLGICCNNSLLWLAATVARPLMINPLLWTNLAKVCAIVGTVALSFLGMRLWVFASKNRQGSTKEVSFSPSLDADTTLPRLVALPRSGPLGVKHTAENLFLTKRSLSVILPAHNEEAIIAQTVHLVVTVLTPWVRDFEVIVVNDGSKDNTKTIVEQIAAADQRVRLVNHPINQGYGAALVSGFNAVTKDLTFFMDSDGQFDIHDLKSFFTLIEEYHAVLGYRMDRQDTQMRKLNAWGWKCLVSAVFGVHVRDVDCAFKLYRSDFFRTHSLETGGAMINAEILYKLKRYGYTTTQVGVRHLPRTSGRATGAKLSVILRALREMFFYARKWRSEELQAKTAQPEIQSF